MMKLCCLGLWIFPLSAMALDAGPSSPQQQETENWLVLQSRNKVASRTPQPASAAEREEAMQRWLKKYRYDIPDLYDPDAGGKIEVNK